MKKILLLLFILIGFVGYSQNPDYHRYGVRTPFTKYISYTTSQRDALTPSSTDRTIIHHKDTGINRLEQWDGDSWEELGGDGAVESVQGYIGTVVISPDDLDDFSTLNKFVTQEDKDLINTALQDAPSDGNEYVRKDGDWEVATGGGDNIYNADGTLEGDRSINLDGHVLTVVGSSSYPSLYVNDTISVLNTKSGNKIRGLYTSGSDEYGFYTAISNTDVVTSKHAGINLYNADSTLIKLSAEKLIFNVDGTTPDTGDVLTLQSDGTTKFQAPSGGGGATNAENVIVSPSIGGNTDAYAVMEANRTSIDSIQANMSSGINTAPTTIAYSSTMTDAYTASQPNRVVTMAGNGSLEITGSLTSGDTSILEVLGTGNITLINSDESTLIVAAPTEVWWRVNSVGDLVWYKDEVGGGASEFNVISITGDGDSTLDFTTSPYYNVTFGAQDEIIRLTPPASSMPLRLTFVQDGVGGREVVWADDLYAPGGILPTLSTGANNEDVIHLFYDAQAYRFKVDESFNDYQLVTSTLDKTPPTAPTSLIASGATTTTMDLDWTASTDNVAVTGYNVYVDGVLEADAGLVLTYTVTGLTPSTSYDFTVRAYDLAGNESVDSNTVTISTAGAGAQPSIDVGAYTTANFSVAYNSTGTMMVVGDQTTGTLHAWTLSTPNDPTTATYSGSKATTFGIASLRFKSDDSGIFRMWNNILYEYDFGTPLDITTLVAGDSFDFTSVTTQIEGFDYTSNKFYVVSDGAINTVYQFSWTVDDPTTIVYDSVSYSVVESDDRPRGISVKPDGTGWFLCGDAGNDITPFTMTSGNISTSSAGTPFSVATEDTNPEDTDFLKSNGEVMLMSGRQTNKIYFYTLGTGWDLSTSD